MRGETPPTLFETTRLRVRRLGPDDLVELLEVYGDVDAMRWVDDGGALSEGDGRRWIDLTATNYERYGYGMSVLVERASGEVVGFMGLVHPGGQPEAELKYALKRRFWGAGLATEAARAMLGYGEEVHGLRHVIATTAPENLASHRVLLKSGMTRGELVPNDDGSVTQVFDWCSEDDATA